MRGLPGRRQERPQTPWQRRAPPCHPFDPRLAQVLLALSLSPLLTGLSSPRFVSFEKSLVYSRLAALTLGAKLVSIAVTIAIAIEFRSYWALVVGILGGNLTSLVLSYLFSPHRPRLSLSRFSLPFVR